MSMIQVSQTDTGEMTAAVCSLDACASAEEYTPRVVLCILPLEFQRDRIEAVALAHRWRAVVKDVPEMCVAPDADDFGAVHEEGVVGLLQHVSHNGFCKTRPTRTGFKFCAGGEDRQVAADATIRAFVVLFQEQSAERRFCAFFPRHLVLLLRQLRPPLGIGFDDFLDVFHGGADRR